MAKVIAEFCANHKGNWNILKEMIWKAAEAGADYAKVQSGLADEVTYRERFEQGIVENGRIKVIKRPYQHEYDRLKSVDLTEDLYQKFVNECKNCGIEPLTTIFTRQRLLFILSLGMKSIKIASPDCASLPLIRDLKDKFKQIYVSTGATFDDEIEKTAYELRNCNYTFLHCVSLYPTPLKILNLKRMNYLRKFTNSVGFSDHSLISKNGINASIIALALGADVIERHFTIINPNVTKDGPISVNPDQLKELVEFAKQNPNEIMEYMKRKIPNWEIALGQEKRDLTHEELLNRDYHRGRFANKVNGKIIYNWEEKKVY